MNRLSRFLPSFAGNSDMCAPFGTIEDELLGLQRVMANARDSEKPVVGSWIMFPGASIARMVAQMEYDFILIDCEHGNIDDAAMYAMVGAVAAEDVSPLVRIPGPDMVHVKRALDAGAHGILCPSMSTAEEARILVSYAKFPATTKKVPSQSPSQQRTSQSQPNPTLLGIRGVGSPFAPSVFRQTMAEYIRTANRNIFVAVQIETLDGLTNCEEIANVDGIDMLFIGPNDLASSMGYPPLEHESIPEVQNAIKRVLEAAKKAGKYAGMFCSSADQVRARFAQGFDLMNLGGDVVALIEWNATQLGKLDDIRKVE